MERASVEPPCRRILLTGIRRAAPQPRSRQASDTTGRLLFPTERPVTVLVDRRQQLVALTAELRR